MTNDSLNALISAAREMISAAQTDRNVSAECWNRAEELEIAVAAMETFPNGNKTLENDEKEQNVTERDDCVIVPNEITLEMSHAYFKVIDDNHALGIQKMRGRYENIKIAYRAMLAAAPKAPKREVSGLDIGRMKNMLKVMSGWTDKGIKEIPEHIAQQCRSDAREMLAMIKDIEGGQS